MKPGTLLLILTLGLSSAGREAAGQTPATLTTLHTFGGGADYRNGDGQFPADHLLQSRDGSFYGVTQTGGANRNGVVFKLTPDGAESIVHTFDASERNNTEKNVDGAYPAAALVQDAAGRFYGTTLYGGDGGRGTVFQLTPEGTLADLHRFDRAFSGVPGEDTAGLNGLVQGRDGAFYGTAGAGGAAGAGVVFRITADGTLTPLHEFSAGAHLTGANADGTAPYAALAAGRDGNFYGTAFTGGASGHGTVFRVTADGRLTTLHSFGPLSNGTNADGSSPRGLVRADDGNFYGTAVEGGPGGSGVAFRLTPAGEFSVLHAFTAADGSGSLNADGAAPGGTLIQGSDGNLYGTTSFGGAGGTGTLYRLTPTGTLTTLYSFRALDATGANPDGANPNSLIQGADGAFYGTTSVGGIQRSGAAFRLTVPLARPSPVITSAASATAGAGQTFVYQITATDRPTRFTASGLPAGLSVDAATGRISGAAGSEGSYPVALSATRRKRVGTATLALTVGAPREVPSVTLAATAPTVAAGSGAAGEFTLQLSSAQDRDVAVSYAIGGSAVSGTDYQTLPATGTLKAGRTSKVIKVVPQGDAGAKRTVVLTLQPGEGYAVGTPGKVRVKIVGP